MLRMNVELTPKAPISPTPPVGPHQYEIGPPPTSEVYIEGGCSSSLENRRVGGTWIIYVTDLLNSTIVGYGGSTKQESDLVLLVSHPP